MYFVFNRTLIDDLAQVPSLESLEELHLSDTKINDITGIGIKFINLKKLYLTGTLLTDINGIQGLIHLEELSLSNTPLKKECLTNLFSLKNLKKLYLEEVDLDANTILSLKVLSNLEYVEVDYKVDVNCNDELNENIVSIQHH